MPRVLLEVTSGQSAAVRAVAESGQSIRLGRDVSCHLSFPLDATVSREHCQVVVDDDGVRIQDSSTYGTTVNGESVTSAELHDGDHIGFGHDIVIAVLIDSDEDNGDPTGTLEYASIAYLGPTASLSSLVKGHAEDPDAPIGYQIEFLGPERLGQKLKFPLNQAVVIGRLPACEIYISTDPVVSRRHCRIAWEAGGLVLESQGAHGSRVNGNEVKRAELVDRDEVEIGAQTRFRVSVVYPGLESDTEEGFRDDNRLAVARIDVPNGLTIFRVELTEGASILSVLAELLPDYHALMILDRLKSGAEITAGLDVSHYLLCERYPEQVLPQISPVMPGPEIWVNDEFISDISGSDAFLLVMSRPGANLEQVVAHMRQLSDLNPAHGHFSGGQTLFAYWWPSMLASICRTCPAGTASVLMQGVDALAFEVDDGAVVELVTSPELAENLSSRKDIDVQKADRRAKAAR